MNNQHCCYLAHMGQADEPKIPGYTLEPVHCFRVVRAPGSNDHLFEIISNLAYEIADFD
jgi:hypothetical protein